MEVVPYAHYKLRIDLRHKTSTPESYILINGQRLPVTALRNPTKHPYLRLFSFGNLLDGDYMIYEFVSYVPQKLPLQVITECTVKKRVGSDYVLGPNEARASELEVIERLAQPTFLINEAGSSTLIIVTNDPVGEGPDDAKVSKEIDGDNVKFTLSNGIEYTRSNVAFEEVIELNGSL